MAGEYKSFLSKVGGNEGEKCKYTTRLDTYGRGCSHDCSYCYAKSLLSFRKMWDPKDPAVADINKIARAVQKLEPGSIVWLGGMTDCFQPIEAVERVTLETIKLLNQRGVGYLIVTKSAMVANDEYMAMYDPKLCHIQVSVTTLDDARSAEYEKASPPSERVAAILKLQKAGFDVAIRLSPLMEEYMDFDKLNSLGIEKAIVEFLRVNWWIEQWFHPNVSRYTIKSCGYHHLPLVVKQRILAKVKIPSISVCEDVTMHYEYWRDHFNPNPEDCCNLRR